MTDVIKIAMDCRATLVAEVARLDNFIRMAEALLKYGQDGYGGASKGSDEAGSSDPVKEPGSEAVAIEDDAKKRSTVVIAATKPKEAIPLGNSVSNILLHSTQVQKGAQASPTNHPRPADPAPASSDHFFFNEKPVSDEAVLLLSNPLPSEDAAVDVHIGQKLRQRRWMMGMSGQQLGEIIGVGIEQIKAYESGSVHIGSNRMWEIASALEMPMSYFFEGIEGEVADTSEARGEVLTDKEALALVGSAPDTRTAQAS